MTYIIGGIVVLLLIALVLVFRPPKPKPQSNQAISESVADLPTTTEEELDLDIQYGGRTEAESDEELELTLDEEGGVSGDMIGGHEEIEELDLVMDEEGDRSESSATDDMPAPAASIAAAYDEDEDLIAEESVSGEFDEDIPFIEEEGFERKADMTPALADVPEDYGQLEEDETPEELAERLEYFLGTGDEEQAMDIAETAAAEVEEPSEPEEVAEAAPEKPPAVEEVAETEPEISTDAFAAELKRLAEKLRHEMDAAIASKDTVKLGPLQVAVEELSIKEADIQGSFQAHQQLMAEMESALAKVKESLSGFQLESALNSLRKGEYEVVRTMLADSVQQLEASPLVASEIQYLWGRMEEGRGDFTSALEMYTKASALDENNGDALFAAGRLARITGDTENALAMLEQRVGTGRENGEETVELARAEHELARTLVAADDKERVEELLAQSLATMEKLLGPEHSDLGPVLHDMALVHDGAGRYEQAEPLYVRAITITENTVGKESPRLGVMLNKLAGLYEEIEMEEKSEDLYARALEIRKKMLGENHPDVGTIMGHLANLYKQKGKYEQAEPLYRKSLEIAEATLGKDHPNLAVALTDMAELYSAMGNEEQAEIFQERAFACFGVPGMGDGFVEMEKDDVPDAEDDDNEAVAGN